MGENSSVKEGKNVGVGHAMVVKWMLRREHQIVRIRRHLHEM